MIEEGDREQRPLWKVKGRIDGERYRFDERERERNEYGEGHKGNGRGGSVRVGGKKKGREVKEGGKVFYRFT